MTRSKGAAEEVSLPPTRIRKDVSTTNEGKNKAQGQVQANVQSQQRTADTPSPFALPGSRAGTSTTPASEAGVQPAPSNLFTRPNSRAGFTPPKPTSPHSSSSSPMSGHQFQEDVNTSVSWDLIDTDTDMAKWECSTSVEATGPADIPKDGHIPRRCEVRPSLRHVP